jgi:ComEC/Rec2-related protein
MILFFLSLMGGIYLHSLFPYSLILLLILFFPVKYLKMCVIFFVIGTMLFYPYNIDGYHTIYGKVISSNGNTLIVSPLKIDNRPVKNLKVIIGFSDKIYKTSFDEGYEIYFKGNMKKITTNVYYSKISTKDLGFLPSNSFFSHLRSFYLSKISKARNKDIIASILLNYKSFNKNILKLLRDSGFSPLFAISGLHIGLIALSVYYLLNFLSILWKRIAVIIFLILYIFLIGFSLSAMRAVSMILLFMVLSLLDLPIDNRNIISVVGMAFLFYNPSNAYDAGFLMSFFGAIGLIMSPKKFFYSLIYLFAFTFPLTSLFFSKIFILSFLFQSIVVVPIITIFLIIGILFLVVPFSIFLSALDRISDLIYLFMNMSSKMANITYKLPITFVILYYIGLFTLIFYREFKKDRSFMLEFLR